MGGGFRVALGSGISAEGGGAEAAQAGLCASVRFWVPRGARGAWAGLASRLWHPDRSPLSGPWWRPPLGGDPFGPALCSDAVWSRVPVAPKGEAFLGGRGLKLRV